MDSMRRNAQKMMPHIMALNKNPTMGMKNNRQPKPGVSNLTAYAKGGKVMAKGGAADKKQDKSMLSRHNKLMHPGQKSKLMSGGMVKGYAEGGGSSILTSKDFKGKSSAEELANTKKEIETIRLKKLLRDEFSRLGSERSERESKRAEIQKERDNAETINVTAKKPSSFREEFNLQRKLKGAGEVFTWNGKEYSTNKADDAPRSDASFVKRAQQRNKETAPSDDYKYSGYKKGGKVKGDKKKVMGTVGEAKALINAMKKVRRPATPMPGARMAGLGMAPPMAPQMMAPPMKRGGKVRKYADGGKSEAKGFLDKSRDFITDDRYPGKKLSIRDLGKGIKEGFTNYKDMINRTGKFESPSKDGKVMKRAAGGSTKRHTNSKGV
jgi:hypothetical protein